MVEPVFVVNSLFQVIYAFLLFLGMAASVC